MTVKAPASTPAPAPAEVPTEVRSEATTLAIVTLAGRMDAVEAEIARFAPVVASLEAYAAAHEDMIENPAS